MLCRADKCSLLASNVNKSVCCAAESNRDAVKDRDVSCALKIMDTPRFFSSCALHLLPNFIFKPQRNMSRLS